MESGPRRVVIKIGTNSVVEAGRLSVSTIAQLVESCALIQARGFQVVIVSSGAVGVGCQALGITERPTELSKKQAMAAVGQIRLMRMYEDLFQAVGTPCAQVLLSFENLSHQDTNRNAKNTFDSLLSMGVIPIVNENDTVATQELRFGDNDRLYGHGGCNDRGGVVIFADGCRWCLCRESSQTQMPVG